MFALIAVILGMILVVCIAGFVILVMIHAKMAAYYDVRGNEKSAGPIKAPRPLLSLVALPKPTLSGYRP